MESGVDRFIVIYHLPESVMQKNGIVEAAHERKKESGEVDLRYAQRRYFIINKASDSWYTSKVDSSHSISV